MVDNLGKKFSEVSVSALNECVGGVKFVSTVLPVMFTTVSAFTLFLSLDQCYCIELEVLRSLPIL